MRGSAAAIAAGVVLVLAPVAQADETIEAGPSNRYVNPQVEIDQGERLLFRNNDVARHDVVSMDTGSDGEPLFRSPLVGNGEEAEVAGAQYLKTGSYAFFCSIHTNMTGTLTVNSSGTPLPRPGPPPTPPGADTTAPKVKVSLRSATRRGIGLFVRSDEAITYTATVRSGGRTVARGSLRHTGASKLDRVVVRLTAAGRTAVKRGRRLSLAVTLRAKDAAGNRATAKRSGRLTVR